MVPVFARRLPSALVPFIRRASDPSTPATGSADTNGDAPAGSCMRCRSTVRACGAMRSWRDSPDPSTICSASSGTPHAANRLRNPSSAASLVAGPPGAALSRITASP